MFWKYIRILSVAAMCFATSGAFSQFEYNVQYMGRGEMRHGYASLSDTAQKPSVFLAQRARFGVLYKHEKFKVNFAVQDVRTWGSVANAAIDTKGLLSVYEANVELLFNKQWSAKLGRQPISYDDDRIFGTLDWAMQGRRHDAALLKWKDSLWTVEAGAAYNQNSESGKWMQYTVANNYKSFQYLWANKKFSKGNCSFLFLNNGVALNKLNTQTGKTDSITVYSQTIGLRGEYKLDKISLLGYAYYQTGKTDVRKLSAYDLSFEIGYKPVKGFLVTLGAELLSGTSQTDTVNKTNNSFNPFYGTNHRFNGYMDYFYVGNHINSVGLLDGYLRVSYTAERFICSLNGHYFNAAADVRDMKILSEYKARDPHLGAEIDATLLYKYTDGISVQAGYSQMFGTETLKTLKGGSISTTSNWAYIMLIVRPGTSVKFPKVGLKM